MSATRLQGTYSDITGYRLSNTSLLRMFPVMQDDDGNRFLNIFRSYTIYEDTLSDLLYFDTYTTDNDDWWDLIAYRLYQNVGLWWITCVANNVVNPFEELEPGQNLKILYMSYVSQLIKEINNISEL